MVKGIILSGDTRYANNMRGKCLQRGLELEHLNSVSDLISYMIIEKKGVVLLDIRHSSKIISLIYDNFVRNNYLDFKFIMLNDFSNEKYIDIDGVYGFSANASNIDKVLNQISETSTMPLGGRLTEEQICDKITNFLHEFGLSDTMKGFKYLIEAIKFRLIHFKEKILLKDIYFHLANIFGEDISNLEKCIRVSVRQMSEVSTDNFKNVFGKIPVTVNVFINILASNIIK